MGSPRRLSPSTLSICGSREGVVPCTAWASQLRRDDPKHSGLPRTLKPRGASAPRISESNMLLLKLDGSGWVEINWIDANLKMAADAERAGDDAKAKFYWDRAWAAAT